MFRFLENLELMLECDLDPNTTRVELAESCPNYGWKELTEELQAASYPVVYDPKTFLETLRSQGVSLTIKDFMGSDMHMKKISHLFQD